MAATLYFGSWYLPYMVAVLLTIVVRLLITGALHEDGLADFIDAGMVAALEQVATAKREGSVMFLQNENSLSLPPARAT